jgi:hypothetical protein
VSSNAALAGLDDGHNGGGPIWAIFEVIPGLYCGSESAGGFSQHGLARAACQGYIAGRAAAAVPVPRS